LAHGLRKSAATRLADAGCTEAQDAFTLGDTQREQTLANPVEKLAKSNGN